MKLLEINELKEMLKKNKSLVIIISVILAMVLGVCIFTGFISTPLTDSLNGFNEPSYIPEGYVSIQNNSTAGVDKTFSYGDKENNNYFMIAAIKDPKKSEYTELINDSLITEGMNATSENIIVNGHPVTFKVLIMDFMGMHMNLFHATWTCTHKGLNIVVTGKIGANETENMKKMITTLQCHPEKGWKIL